MCVTANDYMNKLDFTEDDFILSKGIIFSGNKIREVCRGTGGVGSNCYKMQQFVTVWGREMQ